MTANHRVAGSSPAWGAKMLQGEVILKVVR